MSAFNSLDYRRFDHLGSDSDEESTEGLIQPGPEMIHQLMEMRATEAAGHTWRGAFTPGRIKIHPADALLGLL